MKRFVVCSAAVAVLAGCGNAEKQADRPNDPAPRAVAPAASDAPDDQEFETAIRRYLDGLAAEAGYRGELLPCRNAFSIETVTIDDVGPFQGLVSGTRIDSTLKIVALKARNANEADQCYGLDATNGYNYPIAEYITVRRSFLAQEFRSGWRVTGPL